MQFNSWEFLLFVSGLLVLYWLFYKKTGIQNVLLMAGSYYFYSRFHLLFPVYLLALTLVGYVMGVAISQAKQHRKLLLVLGIVLLSSCVIILKYTNFIINTLNAFGTDFQLLTLLVPVGVSFYTFGSIGYITDVYRKNITAEKNIITYSAYIGFFPHVLAGPIPSAVSLLPFFRQKRVITEVQIEPAIQQIC